MKAIKLLSVILMSTFIFSMLFYKVTMAEKPQTNEVFATDFFVSDVNGDPLVSDDSYVYNSLCEEGLEPILDPEGNPVTYGQWSSAQGTVSVKCVRKGTHIVFHLSGLIPKGVYTVWVVPFKDPGFTPDFANMIGEGSLGMPDGSQNTFVASESGKGSLSAIHPGGDLSEWGFVDGCLLYEFEIHLIGAYHIDGQTYGATPGPVLGTFCTYGLQFVSIFPTLAM